MKTNGNVKISRLQLVLTVLSVSCLLISNIAVSKQMLLPFGIVMTCSNLVFPLTYVLSDVFSEVYGYKWSRFTCYLGFGMNLLMALVLQLSIVLPYPAYWENQAQFKTIFGTSFRVLIASFSAFIVGDFINDKVFEVMKKKSKNKFFLRAILSSVVGQVTDSVIFCSVAFIGVMSINDMLMLLAAEIMLKTAYEILILPITNIVVKKVSKYEKRSEMNGE
jgi:uncharacterized integral membrane protein (TIGR00697 family)